MNEIPGHMSMFRKHAKCRFNFHQIVYHLKHSELFCGNIEKCHLVHFEIAVSYAFAMNQNTKYLGDNIVM